MKRENVTPGDRWGIITEIGVTKPIAGETLETGAFPLRWGEDLWGHPFPYDDRYDEQGLLRPQYRISYT